MEDVELRNLMKELEKNSITMKKFLSYYCGISGESLKNVNISHEDIKKLMPDLERVGFDYVQKNKSKLYTGKIIAVRDFYNHVVPYMPPVLSNEADFITVQVVEDDKPTIMQDAILSEDLSRYDLYKLYRMYKQSGMEKEARAALKLLRMTKGKTEQYKKQKKLLKWEGR